MSVTAVPTIDRTPPVAAAGIRRLPSHPGFLGLAGAAALIAALPFVPTGGVAARAIVSLVELSACAALVVRTRSTRLVHRRSWMLITVALGLWAAGDLVTSGYLTVLHRTAPMPGVPDLLYLPAFAVGAVGLFLLSSERTGLGVEIAVDTAVLGVGAGVPMYVLWIEPTVLARPGPLATKLILVLYPVLDFAFLVLLGRMLLIRRSRAHSVTVLAAAVFTLFTADVVQAVAFSSGRFGVMPYVQMGWLATAVLLATAGWHPSTEDVVAESAWGAARTPRPRVALLIIVNLLVPGSVLLAVAERPTATHDIVVGFAALATMSALLLVRSARAARLVEALSLDREELLSRALRASEEERAAVAVEIHDGPIQGLTAATLFLSNASRWLARGDSQRAAELSERASAAVVAGVSDLRSLMTRLRPPALDETGIGGAVRDLVRELSAGSAVQATLDLDEGLEATSDLETIVYRIAQEALRNVQRHAGATGVHVTLRGSADTLELEVSDDGRGFTPARRRAAFGEGRFGLAVMAHRAEMVGGWVDVVAAAGRGTTVRATFPRRL